MIGIDTNVLVRYILQDEPKQSRLATQLIERSSEENLIFINGIILCEIVWVLETAYEYPKPLIVKLLEQILRTRQFHIHESDILWQALRGYKNDGADFADNYIAMLNAHHNCKLTMTFDKRASKLKHFKLLTQTISDETCTP